MRRDSPPAASSSGSGSAELAEVSAPRAQFATTRWTMVLSAGRRSSPQSRAALAALCETYWYPLFVYARRRGLDANDAADLIQDFFANLLEKETIGAADPLRGRFRSFLLAALTNFLANLRRRRRARKRGGGKALVSIDQADAETRYRLEPADVETPERLFERRWALTVLERAMDQLRDDYARSGKTELFERLSACIGVSGAGVSYDEVAAALAMTEGAVKTAVHRLRRRLREVLRDEIAHTVDRPEDVDDELRELIAALT
jgi:RNA polymerase sigma factor (sigma-70 family)